MNVFHYIKIQGELQLLSEDSIRYNKFLNSMSEGQRTESVFRSPQEIRTQQANRYLWFCYGFFVPDNFETTQEVHEHFSREFLTEVDIIDSTEQSFDKFLVKLSKEVSTTIKDPIQVIQKDVNIFEIHWVKSTTRLSKKEFWNHIENNIIKRASDLGIVIPEPNQIDLEKL
jgi:hypothetical protein